MIRKFLHWIWYGHSMPKEDFVTEATLNAIRYDLGKKE